MVKTLFILLFLQTLRMQDDYPIAKLWLFSQTVYSGNVPRLPNGKQGKGFSKKMLCYIEIGKTQPMPAWQTAVIYGKQYTVEAAPIIQDTVETGTLKNTHLAVIIKAEAGYKLVQLILTNPTDAEKPEQWHIILSGTLNAKPAYRRSNENVTELSDQMMP